MAIIRDWYDLSEIGMGKDWIYETKLIMLVKKIHLDGLYKQLFAGEA
jgi:hypothetical protein